MRNVQVKIFVLGDKQVDRLARILSELRVDSPIENIYIKTNSNSSNSKNPTEKEDPTSEANSTLLRVNSKSKLIRRLGVQGERTLTEIFGDDPLISEFLAEVPSKTILSWVKIYEPEWVKSELKKAYVWTESNPRRAPRKIGPFMANWLSRGWETKRKQNRSEPAFGSMLSDDELRGRHE